MFKISARSEDTHSIVSDQDAELTKLADCPASFRAENLRRGTRVFEDDIIPPRVFFFFFLTNVVQKARKRKD